jgi:hypothetical protein
MALRILLIFVILGSLIVGRSETSGADWTFYAGSEFGSYHYNSENIGYLPDHLVRISQKLVLTKKGRINLTGELGKEYENISELLVLREIDCMSKKSRILEVAYCYEEGKIIKKTTYQQQLNWDSISPDSVDDILHRAVCKPSEDQASGDIENPYLPFSPENLCQLKIRLLKNSSY